MHGLISDIQMYWDGLGDVVLTTTPVSPIAYAEKDCKYETMLFLGYLFCVFQGVANVGFKLPLCSQYYTVELEAALFWV